METESSSRELKEVRFLIVTLGECRRSELYLERVGCIAMSGLHKSIEWTKASSVTEVAPKSKWKAYDECPLVDRKTLSSVETTVQIVSVIKNLLSFPRVSSSGCFEALNKLFKERMLSWRVFPGYATVGGKQIQSSELGFASTEIFESVLFIFLNRIPLEIEVSHCPSAYCEELPPLTLKESQCDKGQQQNEDEIRKFGVSKKRIPTQVLQKPSWSLLDLPSIEIPGVASISLSLNPCVTDIRSRRVSTKTYLFGELMGQALENHKKKVKKFTFLVHGFVHGCKSQVECRNIAFDVQNEQGTMKVIVELEEWKELKKIQDETVLVEHIIELIARDI